MGVLQLVSLDVLPEGLDDAGAGLRVNAKQASQARVQLKLGRLWRRCNRITTFFFFFLNNRPRRRLYISLDTSDSLIVFPPRLGNGCQVSTAGPLQCNSLMFLVVIRDVRPAGCHRSRWFHGVDWSQSCNTGGSYLWTELWESVHPSPGSPASAAECSARSRLLAFSPGSRPSPGWWPCDATETTSRHTLTTHPDLTSLILALEEYLLFFYGWWNPAGFGYFRWEVSLNFSFLTGLKEVESLGKYFDSECDDSFVAACVRWGQTTSMQY